MTMPAPAALRSLRTELLVKLALLLLVAASLPVGLLSLPRLTPHDPVALALIVGADIVFCTCGAAIVLQRSIVQPLHEVARAAQDIVAGDLARRMPETSLRELHNVTATFDRLTERVLADQAQLVRAEKLASIGRLAASVAHEIGNPLGAILGQVHLLRRTLRDRANALDLLTAIERESARIERIVRGLLDYARARPPAPIPIDVDDVIRSTVDLLRNQGLFEEVDVVLELTDEPLFISGQRHDLEQLFVNLLVNAVDAMQGQARERARLVVRSERAARFTLREPATRRTATTGEAVIEHPPSSRAQRWLATNDAIEIAKIIVADSGPGVAPDLAERIFDPFFTTKPAGKGTGLGLAIVLRIVENFQGTIWVTNAREGGAAFHILFPIVVVPADLPRALRSGRRRPTPPLSRARVTRS